MINKVIIKYIMYIIGAFFFIVGKELMFLVNQFERFFFV